MIRKQLSLGLLIVLFTASQSLAVPTRITVRVLSKGAKFVGTSMGGASVTIRDGRTGEVLTRGVTKGATGNTQLIMNTPRVHGISISDQGSAKFEATIDIDEPKFIEVSAHGPMHYEQSANRVSATQWIVPGKHVSVGDAWILELPGLVVDVVSHPGHVELKGAPRSIRIEANVTAMCGCRFEPGGVWDANKLEVGAILKRDGKSAGTLSFRYADKASLFFGTLNVKEPGMYDLVVYAYDPYNGNTGIDKLTFVVE